MVSNGFPQDFCASFDVSEETREESGCVYNCLSLEVSTHPLGERVQPPLVARKLSWVNNVWPSAQQQVAASVNSKTIGPPPQVQKYCIMSMKNAFTGENTWTWVLFCDI